MSTGVIRVAISVERRGVERLAGAESRAPAKLSLKQPPPSTRCYDPLSQAGRPGITRPQLSRRRQQLSEGMAHPCPNPQQHRIARFAASAHRLQPRETTRTRRRFASTRRWLAEDETSVGCRYDVGGFSLSQCLADFFLLICCSYHFCFSFFFLSSFFLFWGAHRDSRKQPACTTQPASTSARARAAEQRRSAAPPRTPPPRSARG